MKKSLKQANEEHQQANEEHRKSCTCKFLMTKKEMEEHRVVPCRGKFCSYGKGHHYHVLPEKVGSQL